VEKDSDGTSLRRGEARARLRLGAGVGAIALAGVLAGMTKVSVAGHWQGLFVLAGREGPTLEVKDDLLLGDGSRLLLGVSFSRVRAILHRDDASPQPRLVLEWNGRDGSGLVRNHLGDGTELVTVFARYVDSEGAVPHGLFVGGALPEIAADPELQNESGMTFRNARGWTHVWCNVNEAIWFEGQRDPSYPSSWRFLGSRVVIHDRDRVVLESSHEIRDGAARLRMDRYAYFRAGQPYFKLGIKLVNVGDADVRYDYLYGDEPWVGNFGSADGNVGWSDGRVLAYETVLNTREARWAGILDRKSGVANFIAWHGADVPDLGYVSNEPGRVTPRPEPVPLSSNEVFIGLEWTKRVLHPGEGQDLLLALGMAGHDDATGKPSIPDGAAPPP
jgi:hypothetical protein